jgi:methyl coenzyme M reductase subunit C
VRNLAGSTRLYVIKGDRVEERLVTLGQTVGDAVEIVNGVAEGDQVAQTNVERLVDGGRVRVGAAGAVTPASSPARGGRQED